MATASGSAEKDHFHVTESYAGQSVTDRHVTILLLQDLYYDMVCDFFFFFTFFYF